MKDTRATLGTVERIVTDFQLQSLVPQIQAVAESLADGGIVDVAVLGQFKAGKSSLLNSLVDRHILPVDVLPTTSVVTRIGFGAVDQVLVRHLSGEVEEVPMEMIPEFITEGRNPDNRKQVAMVEVESPALDRFRGVRFVDTPGLGSIFRHNTRTSLNWLPRVGAAVVAVSVDHPVSEQDIGLLDELARYTPEMFVLLTKADSVSAEQVETIIRFTRVQLEKHLGCSIPVLPFSIRAGFERQREALRELLVSRVVENHEARFDEILDHKIHGLVRACHEYLSVALKAARADEEALAELVRLLAREKADFAQVRNEIWLVAADHKQRIQNASFERFVGCKERSDARLQAELRVRQQEWRGNLAQTSEHYKAWMESALDTEMKTLSLESEDFLAPHLAQAQTAISRAVRAFQDRLSAAIRRALGIALAGAQFEGQIEEPSKPDVHVGKTFDIPFELLWFVVPMAIFRPVVNRHLQRRITWEVEKNLFRLGMQWAEASNRCLDDLAVQAQEFIRKELATVEHLISGTRTRRSAIEGALGALEQARPPAAPAASSGSNSFRPEGHD